MIPLYDEKANQRVAWSTTLILVANVVLFVYSAYVSRLGFEGFIDAYAFVPAGGHAKAIPMPAALFLSLFLHGGVSHLLGNMWFLWVFGRKLEDRMGAMRFLFFYVCVGFLATLTHMMLSTDLGIPLIGASGAIAGVLGGYFLLFPFRRIHTLLPLLFFFTVVRIPAVIFLGMWFLMQLLYAKLGFSYVAWWAHVGGFVSGVLLIYPFLRR